MSFHLLQVGPAGCLLKANLVVVYCSRYNKNCAYIRFEKVFFRHIDAVFSFCKEATKAHFMSNLLHDVKQSHFLPFGRSTLADEITFSFKIFHQVPHVMQTACCVLRRLMRNWALISCILVFNFCTDSCLKLRSLSLRQ